MPASALPMAQALNGGGAPLPLPPPLPPGTVVRQTRLVPPPMPPGKAAGVGVGVVGLGGVGGMAPAAAVAAVVSPPRPVRERPADGCVFRICVYLYSLYGVVDIQQPIDFVPISRRHCFVFVGRRRSMC